jgi:uncharacterized membrane protein
MQVVTGSRNMRQKTSAKPGQSGSAYTEDVVRVECKPPARLSLYSTLSAVLLASSISLVAQAQDENAACPCFSYEEVEGVFLSGDKLLASGGGGNCQASDYSVEFKGEVVVIDEDYKMIARASVDWADFDPGHCNYSDSSTDPAVERSVMWPHPAPEAVARTCLDIISSAIENLDNTHRCRTYP